MQTRQARTEGVRFPSSDVLQLSIPSLCNPALRQVTPGQSHSPNCSFLAVYGVFGFPYKKKSKERREDLLAEVRKGPQQLLFSLQMRFYRLCRVTPALLLTLGPYHSLLPYQPPVGVPAPYGALGGLGAHGKAQEEWGGCPRGAHPSDF